MQDAQGRRHGTVTRVQSLVVIVRRPLYGLRDVLPLRA
jgi:hypothetical protein